MYFFQSVEHARLSIEDLEKSLHGASSIDQWIDSLPILGTPSLNRNKTDVALRTVMSTHAVQKIKRSYTLDHDYSDNMFNGSYRQVSPIDIEKKKKNKLTNYIVLWLSSRKLNHLLILYLKQLTMICRIYFNRNRIEIIFV
jgi:hypothetical protein